MLRGTEHILAETERLREAQEQETGRAGLRGSDMIHSATRWYPECTGKSEKDPLEGRKMVTPAL